MENRDCRDFGLICSQLPGGERKQQPQPGEGNSGQGCPDSLRGLDAWVWQDLGNDEVLVKPSCPGRSAAELGPVAPSFPFPLQSCPVKDPSVNTKPPPSRAALPAAELGGKQPSRPLSKAARCPSSLVSGQRKGQGLPVPPRQSSSALSVMEGPRPTAVHEEVPRHGCPR